MGDKNELLYQYERQLLEKEHSGCHALLRDDKVTWHIHLIIVVFLGFLNLSFQ
jgi:hypothetical protein